MYSCNVYNLLLKHKDLGKDLDAEATKGLDNLNL